MKKQTQRQQNITLSLSKEVIAELHLLVKKRGISHFVEEAITQKLHETKSALEQQYIKAAQDEDRNTVSSEWDHFAGEGLNEQNDW